jgi:HEAT repeat protein
MSPRPLTDEELFGFLRDGFITVQSTLDEAFHARIWAAIDQCFADDGNPGNNLLARMPEIQLVLDDAPVKGALISLLGADYYAQPHRHPHVNRPGSAGQQMHQDGGKRWSHRTRRLLVFYYPQETPEELGPTGVVPGSQYYSTALGSTLNPEAPVVGPAGSVTLANYDLWHRAMPNQGARTRYMMKFLFTRMSEPDAPRWQAEDIYSAFDGDPMEQHAWRWHRGLDAPVTTADGTSDAELLRGLADPDERVGLASAYTLADRGRGAASELACVLGSESEDGARNASYALAALGTEAVDDVARVLSADSPAARARAAETLGDMGSAAGAASEPLVDAAEDGEVIVRRSAVEALGTVCQAPGEASTTLAGALSDCDERVRRNAALALARLGEHASGAEGAIAAALRDESRYVRADAAHALRRVGSPEARSSLLDFLTVARWCPDTSPRSTH